MPWCPKCKNEYRDGILVCSDCGCALIDEKEEERNIIFFGEQNQLELLKKFLEFNNINSSEINFDENESVFELSVASKDTEEALKFRNVFLLNEAQKNEIKNDEVDEEHQNIKAQTGSGLSYQSNEQKAKDNWSSAIVLFVVGGLGFAFLLLSYFGILPFSFRGFVYIVMGSLFIILFAMGFVSMKNSKVLDKKAEKENLLYETMSKWSKENLIASMIDDELENDDLSENEKYFKRVQIMKDKIQVQFLNLDESFLDHFVDEIYDDIF